MKTPRRWPLRAWLLIATLPAVVTSAIGAANLADFRLEILPLPFVFAFLFWLERRYSPLSNAAYCLLFAYLLLHLLGAHYQYSYVPYREWSEGVFGESMPAMLDTERNHYDRLVHLMFGLLIALPMLEIIERLFTLRGWRALVIAVAFLGLFSKLYELAEWGVAVVLSPAASEAYNGQQGDMFDAHKDMALALIGAIASATLIGFMRQSSPGE